MSFKINKEKIGNYRIFKLSGYIDEVASNNLKELFDEAIKSGENSFILDFKDVTILNSVALSLLLDIVSEMIGNPDLSFLITAITSTIKFTFETTGLIHYVKIFPDIESAIQSKQET
jgi:anti-anti-sigma factor